MYRTNLFLKINVLLYKIDEWNTPILNYFYGQQQTGFTLSKIRTYLRT